MKHASVVEITPVPLHILFHNDHTGLCIISFLTDVDVAVAALSLLIARAHLVLAILLLDGAIHFLVKCSQCTESGMILGSLQSCIKKTRC